MLGSLILYLKGMSRVMFQLSGFYYRGLRTLRTSGLRAPRLSDTLGTLGCSFGGV